MDAQVDGSRASVHPLFGRLVSLVSGPRHEPIYDEVGEPASSWSISGLSGAALAAA